MADYIVAATLAYLLFMIFWVTKKVTPIKTIQDFLSLGEFSSEKACYQKMARTFEASNASFATSFLGLFTVAVYNSFYALYLIIGYLIGIAFFAKILLPAISQQIQNNVYYPQMITESSGSKLAGSMVAFIALASMLCFYFTEIFGFSVYFIGSNNEVSSLQSAGIAISILLLLSWYVMIGGFRSVVETDVIQTIFIRVGMAALLGLTLYLASQFGLEQLESLLLDDFNNLQHAVMLPAIIIGFLFSQIIYFDNWQRLNLFYKSLKAHEVEIGDYINKTAHRYLLSVPYLFVIFIVPVTLAVLARTMGEESLFSMLNWIWNESLAGKIAVMLAMLAFISALLSSVDTYMLSAIQILYNRFPSLKISTVRKSIVLLSLFMLPFLVLQLDISQWFKFLFYSLNGVAAPVVLAIMGYQLNKYAVILSSIGGVLIAFIFISNPAIDVIAAVVVLVSFALNFILAKK